MLDSFQANQSYLGSFIKDKITLISAKGVSGTPISIKEGDVYVSYCGAKKRPCVVVKILKDVVVGIPLTSGENIHSSVSYKCRFFNEGFLCNTIDIASKEYVLENFTGIFEDKKAIKLAIENIKEFINKL